MNELRQRRSFKGRGCFYPGSERRQRRIGVSNTHFQAGQTGETKRDDTGDISLGHAITTGKPSIVTSIRRQTVEEFKAALHLIIVVIDPGLMDLFLWMETRLVRGPLGLIHSTNSRGGNAHT